MRMRAHIDRNQPEIVEALEHEQCSVQSLAPVGKGCPDLLVGFRGFNFLMEVKDGLLRPKQQQLNPDQSRWHVRWRGSVDVVNSVSSALHIIRSTHESSDGLLVNAYLGEKAKCRHANREKEAGAVFCMDCGETLEPGPPSDDYPRRGR